MCYAGLRCGLSHKGWDIIDNSSGRPDIPLYHLRTLPPYITKNASPKARKSQDVLARFALQRSANLEAVQHLTTGLALLATFPETQARAQQELDLQLALGPALMAVKGQGAPEVEQVYMRARVLCTQVGETPQLFPVLWGLSLFYTGRGELQSARELAGVYGDEGL